MFRPPATFRPLAVSALALAFAAPAPAADPVDDALFAQAKAIARYARETKKYPTVGILKVMVAYADGTPADHAGELNQALARRLEVATILALPEDANDLVVLRRPGETVEAAGDKVATHLSAEGRRTFFLHRYTPAWGEPGQTVEAAALVVITARLGPALDTLDLTAQAFDATGELTPVPGSAVTAPVTRRVLAELGCGFRTDPDTDRVVAYGIRGVDPALMKKNLPARPVDAAPKPQPVAGPNPADLLHRAEVKLQVFYSDREVAVEPTGTHFRVPPPGKTDRVHFVLTNEGKNPAAAVLKVNGENTIERQTAADHLCRMWVLPPGTSVTVTGALRANDKDWDNFHVLTPEESDARAVGYGLHAGTFRLAVFPGAVAGGKAGTVPEPDEAARAQLAIARGSLDVGAAPAGSLKALQRRLRAARVFPEGMRGGLVVPGGSVESKPVERVRFVPRSDDPAMSLTVWYYEPPARPKVGD